ncbi:MAG: hypothetical protein NW205_00255 [Hyphomicrobiaceae bacterium]|nr:hypothetical protein [Hyphomicrobiaceae bacterium]
MTRHAATARQPSGHATANVVTAFDIPAEGPPIPDPVREPEAVYDAPAEIVEDPALTRRKKLAALDAWDEAAHLRLAAANEGMPAGDKTSEDLAIIEEVAEARAELEGRPTSGGSTVAGRAPTIAGKAARAGSRALTNYRVLVNSLIILAIAAAGLFAWWLTI